MGGGESLVTFVRKAVDFWLVIIHVISVGRSDFSNLINCHAISEQYLVAAQAIYNFAPCLSGICSSVEFCDVHCTCKLGAARYGERASPANQPQ